MLWVTVLSVMSIFKHFKREFRWYNFVWGHVICVMSCLRPLSQGTWWIFNQLKNLTEHFIQTGLINIFTLFTQNFEQPGTQMFVSLRWFCVNRTTVNAQFFSQLKVRPMPSWEMLAPFTRRDILLPWSSKTLTELLCFLSTSIHVHNTLLTFSIYVSWISMCPLLFLT